MTQEQLNQLTPAILSKTRDEIISFLDNDLVIYNYKAHKNLLELPYGEGKSVIIPYGLNGNKRIEFLHYLATNLKITHFLENDIINPYAVNNHSKEDYFLELTSFKNNHKEIGKQFEDSAIRLRHLQCHNFFSCSLCPYAQNHQYNQCPHYQATLILKNLLSSELFNIKRTLTSTQNSNEKFHFINQSSASIKGFITNEIEKKFITSNEDIYNFSKSMFEKFNDYGYLFNKKNISDFYYDSTNKNFFLLDFEKVYRVTSNMERMKDITIKPTNLLKGTLPYYNKGRLLGDFQVLVNIFPHTINPALELIRGMGGNHE